jgi:hypothetical protein
MRKLFPFTFLAQPFMWPKPAGVHSRLSWPRPFFSWSQLISFWTENWAGPLDALSRARVAPRAQAATWAWAGKVDLRLGRFRPVEPVTVGCACPGSNDQPQLSDEQNATPADRTEKP